MSNTRLDVLQIIQEAKEKKNKSLKLSTQKLTEIPLEIFDLEQLEVLDLRNNQIEKIPNEILIPNLIPSGEAYQITSYNFSW